MYQVRFIYLFILLSFSLAQEEYSVLTSTNILHHPIKNHVLSLVGPYETIQFPDLIQQYPHCLFLFLQGHKKNRAILSYFNETLPVLNEKTFLIHHWKPQVEINRYNTSVNHLKPILEVFCQPRSRHLEL